MLVGFDLALAFTFALVLAEGGLRGLEGDLPQGGRTECAAGELGEAAEELLGLVFALVLVLVLVFTFALAFEFVLELVLELAFVFTLVLAEGFVLVRGIAHGGSSSQGRPDGHAANRTGFDHGGRCLTRGRRGTADARRTSRRGRCA